MVVHMGRTAAVAGASGYAGGELLRLLLEHPDLELGPVAGGSAAGKPVTDLHPQLPQLADAVFAATTAEVLGEADVVFLALPHGQSAALAAALPPRWPWSTSGPTTGSRAPTTGPASTTRPTRGVAVRPARALPEQLAGRAAHRRARAATPPP
jgi:hypothetical protein